MPGQEKVLSPKRHDRPAQSTTVGGRETGGDLVEINEGVQVLSAAWKTPTHLQEGLRGGGCRLPLLECWWGVYSDKKRYEVLTSFFTSGAFPSSEGIQESGIHIGISWNTPSPPNCSPPAPGHPKSAREKAGTVSED